MFIDNHNAASRRDHDPPIVEPLRISKPQSPPVPGSQSTSLPYPNDGRPQQTGLSQPPYLDSSQKPSSPHGSSGSPSASTPVDVPASLKPREGKPATLAERRGNAPPQMPPERQGTGSPNVVPGSTAATAERPVQALDSTPHPNYHQQYFPPPSGTQNASSAAAKARFRANNTSSISRVDSTASTSTTMAQRGSPPPPETPIVGPGQQPASDIEARYAAAGIAGTSTLQSLQAQNAAAQQRANQYAGAQPQPGHRPWTPTEQPGTQPYGPPTVYQGSAPIGTQQYPAPSSTNPPAQGTQPATVPPNALEQDFQRLHVTSSPPPAYSSIAGADTSQRYPNEKQRPPQASPPPQGHPATTAATTGVAGTTVASVPPTSATAGQSHPAYAHDPRQNQPGQTPHPASQPLEQHPPASVASPAPSNVPPASPPPLPEGWIAHLDPNSGQYYYIHLPTQSTQWEFPKGPTPLNLNETPMSPATTIYSGHPLASPGLSTFGGKPLGSPGLPMTPGFDPSVAPGPPPASGVELYKVAPTNGVYFGPYLRYTNMDIERGIWLGSILLVTDAPQPPTIHIHQSIDLSPNPRQLKPVAIATHQRWTFYRYDIDLKMAESGPAKWTYAITSHLGCTRYEFLVAGRHETNWRFIATSGNDFALNVSANDRQKLGGVGYMWKDIMQKHAEIGGFHCQLGLGGQIFADRMWKEIPLLKQWLQMRGKEARKNAPWTAAHEEEVKHAYFHYYTSHFDQPYLREAWAQIPYISQVDDHDM